MKKGWKDSGYVREGYCGVRKRYYNYKEVKCRVEIDYKWIERFLCVIVGVGLCWCFKMVYVL